MTNQNKAARRLIGLVLMTICLAPSLGCVALFSNVLHVMGAGLIPPAYPGLKGKKVAVVCVSNSQLFGPTSTSFELASRVNRLLATHVKRSSSFQLSRSKTGSTKTAWDMVNFVEIGRGVEADFVVAIDVRSLTVHDGSTMFKGRANVDMVVYDMKTGHDVFARSPPEIEFPTDVGCFHHINQRTRVSASVSRQRSQPAGTQLLCVRHERRCGERRCHDVANLDCRLTATNLLIVSFEFNVPSLRAFVRASHQTESLSRHLKMNHRHAS